MLRLGLIALAILVVIALVGLGVFYKLAAPRIAQEAITGRLERLEQRTGLKLKTGQVRPDGLRGVILSDVTLHEPDGVTPLVHIKQLRVVIDRTALLAGDKVIREAALDGVTVTVRRMASGELAIRPAIDQLRGRQGTQDTTVEGPAGGVLARYFGDELPTLSIKDLDVRFVSEAPDKPMPIKRLSAQLLMLEAQGQQGQVRGLLTMEAPEAGPWQLPGQVEVSGRLELPLEQSAIRVTLDKPMRVNGLPPAPFVELGFMGAQLEPGGYLHIEGPRLGAAHAEPLLEAKEITVKLARLTPQLKRADVRELVVDSPVVRVKYAADGSSDLDPWFELVRSQRASHVCAHAEEVAAEMDAAKRKAAPIKPAVAEEDEEESAPAAAPAPAGPTMRQRLREQLARLTSGELPERLEVRDARVIIDDARRLPLAGAGPRLQLRAGRAALTHDAAQGVLHAEWSFEALGAEEERLRGGMSGDVTVNYKEFGAKAQLRSQGLDLAWLAQLGGPRVAKHLRGGLLRMNVAVSQAGVGQPIHFEGEVGIDRGAVEWERIAEGVIGGWSASYAFEGTLDLRAKIPKPKLLSDPELAPDPKSNNRKRITIEPPTQGALVFTRGEARLGDAQATVLPSLYGLDLDKPLPTRLGLYVKLPKTRVQTLFDAVPDALKGDLVGTQLAGSFGWEFKLEVPLYDASEMMWRATTELSDDFAIVSMPSAMDVRKLTDSFVHTIVDESINYERRVRIPEMTLTPGDWMLANVGLTPEELDEHWRAGGWFVPPPVRDPETGQLRERGPEYWTSPAALAQRPGKPWSDGYDASILRSWRPPKVRERNKRPILRPDGTPEMEMMSRNPYGPYVYVPLPFISHYVVRAILTTEDHVFFKHDGFNRAALKESVERNLAAQEYVRGASTISMQLVKNLYLSRKKVMSRKLQEAFLVFLIESHLHIPKARLLEIYLNIIEFGPGIFGIHDAAIHYFGKRPDALTLPEAVWIVTLVPSPKRWHQLWEKGTAIPDKGWDRVRRYMQAMVSRGKILQEEMDLGLRQRPTFHHAKMDEPAMVPVAPRASLVPIFGESVEGQPPRPSQERFEEEMRELLE
jgi:hypothetical protein